MTYDSDHDVGIKLDDSTACQAELERCVNGLAVLTQEATANIELLSHFEDQLQQVEAILGRSIRDEAESSLTATEVNGRITDLIAGDPNFAHVRESVITLQAEKDALERRLRTLEKRLSASQSAMNKHLSENRLIGGSGG